MFQRCVVAYDGSKHADAAVAFAFKLAGKALTLAHIVELPRPYEFDTPELVRAIQWNVERSEEEWRERLTALAGGGADVAVLADHKPAAALLDLVAEREADLLVAGTHGVGGLKRAVLGSVSQQLLDHAPCSVLLVRGRPDEEADGVVVAAVDGSPATARVVAAAEHAAEALSARLVLAYVVDDRATPSGWSIEVTDALLDRAREQGRRVLDEAGANVNVPCERELREGAARQELVALCEQRRPLMAVVGSRGRHGFQRLLLGSTARHLVNHAPCPVLVAR